MIWACVKMLFQPRINGGTYWVYYILKCHMVVSENGDSSNLYMANLMESHDKSLKKLGLAYFSEPALQIIGTKMDSCILKIAKMCSL